jgi:hypothetical protein
MAELPKSRFRVGDRVRYVGETQPEGGEGEPCVLLARGLVGHVVDGPDGSTDGPYRVMFGGHAVWLPPERLDGE